MSAKKKWKKMQEALQEAKQEAPLKKGDKKRPLIRSYKR